MNSLSQEFISCKLYFDLDRLLIHRKKASSWLSNGKYIIFAKFSTPLVRCRRQ